jgi:hypothetical protein
MRTSSCYFCIRWEDRSLGWLAIVLPTILLLPFLCYVHSEKILSNRMKIPERPHLVTDALEKDKPIYYFGLGSNMSRKKIENRGINGTKIEIKKMEAAFVPNYRLAFNLRGFPPIEPGMGSLEPVDSSAKALLSYERGECHGALIQLTPENYEKVMRSEGVGNGQSDQGYEEIVVDAYPYEQSQSPVKAVALRARDHVRLNFDPCPSARYMSILREGAEELGLRQSYQEFLKRHPVEILARWQRKQAIFNIFFMFSLSSLLKWRGLSQLQSRIVFLFYTSDSSRKLRKTLSVAITTLILLPGSLIGFMLYHILELLGKTPKSAKLIFDMLDKDPL